MDGAEAEARDVARAEAVPPSAMSGAPITAALIAANAGIFAAQVYLSGKPTYALSVPAGILRWLGANDSLYTIADSRLETLVTSCFLHGSILHLAFNLFALWQVGPIVERAVGPARFFTLYLAAGIAGSASSAIWGRFFGQTLSVGASGAVCGLIGAAIVLGLRTEGRKSELAWGMARWLGLLLLIGLLKYLRGDIVQVDNAAHVGGALGGVIVANAWRRGATYSARTQRAIVAACVALIVGSGVVVYVRDRTDPLLFLDTERRMKAAIDAMRDGRCDDARTAMQRAIAMDPQSSSIRALDDEIARECQNNSEHQRKPASR
ncbi:rhomboid family serine protease [Labilithrix luteola]|uniref:Rhomboid family serine protease n=1 Tax=Labilithrix luteola TaxID=1391654 RepID=A0A0K1QDJ0_9BACT|nr:rhomboid family serine protease [Labilithrix luteola]